ncbi:hypothetical protein [Brevibacillus brevis]|uniref:hypothetical protein n=1 Tax=Brevibacillus brevis TaxID=1393 RepID=UPI001C8DE9D0|nr:hypothetical protein [Brevibacillus brevis]MBY0083726.1 hypothetical protein [Brevibacillus brevis]
MQQNVRCRTLMDYAAATVDSPTVGTSVAPKAGGPSPHGNSRGGEEGVTANYALSSAYAHFNGNVRLGQPVFV